MREEILAALGALAEADRKKCAGPEIEARLREAFRRSVRRRRWKIAGSMAGAAAAAAAIAAMLAPRPPAALPVDKPAVRVERIETPKPAEAVKTARRLPAQPREIVTEFFPLMEAPPPVDHGELVRVSLPAAAMRTVGLPVREDRLSEPVEADVLVSEDGLATAIRFVKVEQR